MGKKLNCRGLKVKGVERMVDYWVHLQRAGFRISYKWKAGVFKLPAW